MPIIVNGTEYESLSEIAHRLGVTTQTVYNWIARGLIEQPPSTRKGKKRVYYASDTWFQLIAAKLGQSANTTVTNYPTLSTSSTRQDEEQRSGDEHPRVLVFISYSHDSPEHMDRVLDLCDQLRFHGVDCQIDQYEESPLEGWQRWMRNQIEDAEFVLVVCTETYKRRFEGREASGVGKGANWEGAVISQDLYDREGKNKKFIPVLFRPHDQSCIPDFLASATCYKVDTEAGYEQLYRRLTKQPRVPKPELGSILPMPPREPREYHFLDEESVRAFRGYELTPREIEVLRLYSEELSIDQISLRLSVMSATVRKHLASAREKLEASSTIDAVIIARSKGFL